MKKKITTKQHGEMIKGFRTVDELHHYKCKNNMNQSQFRAIQLNLDQTEYPHLYNILNIYNRGKTTDGCIYS